MRRQRLELIVPHTISVSSAAVLSPPSRATATLTLTAALATLATALSTALSTAALDTTALTAALATVALSAHDLGESTSVPLSQSLGRRPAAHERRATEPHRHTPHAFACASLT